MLVVKLLVTVVIMNGDVVVLKKKKSAVNICSHFGVRAQQELQLDEDHSVSLSLDHCKV